METEHKRTIQWWHDLRVYVKGREEPWTICFIPEEHAEAYEALEGLITAKEDGYPGMLEVYNEDLTTYWFDPRQIQALEMVHRPEWMEEEV